MASFSIFKKIWSGIIKRASKAEPYIALYGTLSFFGFILFYFLNLYFIAPETSEEFSLRLIAASLSFGLMVKNYWPANLKGIFPLYWNISLIYLIPFFFTFMLIKNSFDTIWCLNSLISFTCLIFLVDWVSNVIIIFIGVICAIGYWNLSTGSDLTIPDNLPGILASYIGMVVYIGLFVRTEDKSNEEKLIAIKSLAGTIAHEMRTPLSAIRLCNHLFQQSLPPLIESYHKAKEAGVVVPPISDASLKDLDDTPEDMDKITSSAFMIIDMLLINLKDVSSLSKNFAQCSIKSCITEMFCHYPLTEKERALISWKNSTDFTFYGNGLLMKHVLFNLLKNALYYVKAANKGGIYLWTETTSKRNFLYFKDTGKGMPSAIVSHVFDRFYSTTNHGTGIGLAFCKSVMESFGGSISCDAKEGGYTTFILQFPISDDL